MITLSRFLKLTSAGRMKCKFSPRVNGSNGGLSLFRYLTKMNNRLNFFKIQLKFTRRDLCADSLNVLSWSTHPLQYLKIGGKFIEISPLVDTEGQTCFDHIQRNLHRATEHFSEAHFLPALTDHIADESAIFTGLICPSINSSFDFPFYSDKQLPESVREMTSSFCKHWSPFGTREGPTEPGLGLASTRTVQVKFHRQTDF